MNILWTHLNSGGGAIFVDRGYNSMDVSVFSFGKKTNYFMICFRRGCQFVGDWLPTNTTKIEPPRITLFPQ